MKIVIDIGKLEDRFNKGFIVKAGNHAESSPFRVIFAPIARALVKEQARRNSRPKRLAAKSVSVPFKDLSSSNLLAFQVEMARVQFILSRKELYHGAAFCQALGLAAAEQLRALGEAEYRRRLN